MRNVDPEEKKKVTNSDEQEIAVNHSTAESGFDEPSTHAGGDSPPAVEKHSKGEGEKQDQVEK